MATMDDLIYSTSFAKVISFALHDKKFCYLARKKRGMSVGLARVYRGFCTTREEWNAWLRNRSTKRITGTSVTSLERINDSSKIFLSQVSL